MTFLRTPVERAEAMVVTGMEFSLLGLVSYCVSEKNFSIVISDEMSFERLEKAGKLLVS